MTDPVCECGCHHHVPIEIQARSTCLACGCGPGKEAANGVVVDAPGPPAAVKRLAERARTDNWDGTLRTGMTERTGVHRPCKWCVRRAGTAEWWGEEIVTKTVVHFAVDGEALCGRVKQPPPENVRQAVSLYDTYFGGDRG